MLSAALRRFLLPGSAALLTAAIVGAADGRPHAAPRQVAVARPADSLTLAGVSYLDLGAFCDRFGLHRQGGAGPARTIVYRSKWSSLELEIDSRDQTVNGLRVFFGEAVRRYRGREWISRLDAELLVTPMLRPDTVPGRVPTLRKIVVDPGHGGRDAGKTNDRLKIFEKDLTLDTSRRLEKLLEARGYDVVLTRRDDRYVELEDRPAIARREHADLFISLHYNSVAAQASSVTGVEVFTMTPQHQYSTADFSRDDDDGAKAAMPGNAHDAWNTLLGYHIDREMLDDLKASDRGLKRARWKVLVLAPCPAVLIESGYLSNDAEARKLATPAYRQKIAEAIAAGVNAYGAALERLRAKS